MNPSPWRVWNKNDEKGLARFVIRKAAGYIPSLSVCSLDEPAQILEHLYGQLCEGKTSRYALNEHFWDSDFQTIRHPTEVLISPKLGTCLDLAVTFAGLCIDYDLCPWIVVFKDHAIVVVSKERRFHEPKRPTTLPEESDLTKLEDVLREPDILIKLIEQDALIPIECTGFTVVSVRTLKGPEGTNRNDLGLLSYPEAIRAGKEQFSNRKFRFALDIGIAFGVWKLDCLHTGSYLENIQRLPTEYSGQIENFEPIVSYAVTVPSEMDPLSVFDPKLHSLSPEYSRIQELNEQLDALLKDGRWNESDQYTNELVRILESIPRRGAPVRKGWLNLAKIETIRLFEEKRFGRIPDVTRLQYLRGEAEIVID